MRHQDHPERDVELLQKAGRKERTGYYTHSLLRVVGAVAEAVGGGGKELQLAKITVHAPGRPAPKDPGDRDHQRGAQDEADRR